MHTNMFFMNERLLQEKTHNFTTLQMVNFVFMKNCEKKDVDKGNIIFHFFKNVKNDVTKVYEKRIYWTDKINAIVLSGRFNVRCFLPVRCKQKHCIICLESPPPWFNANRKTQRKLMQNFSCVMKNCETLDAHFNQRIDDMRLCYHLGTFFMQSCVK